MSFKDFINDIMFYISAPKCVSCKRRLAINEHALCKDCLKEYQNIKLQNCSICSKTLDKCSCTNKYLDKHYIHKIIKVYRYIHRSPMPSNDLIYSLKRDNRRDILKFITNEIYDAICNTFDPAELKDYIFTNVPRRKKSKKKYGIDHSALLAKSIAKRFSAVYYQPIYSKSRKAQKKTEGKERIDNARFKMKRSARSLKDKKVIILDDVITTGASMGACAILIHRLGAKSIIGVSISIAYKDRYEPFLKAF